MPLKYAPLWWHFIYASDVLLSNYTNKLILQYISFICNNVFNLCENGRLFDKFN